MTVRGLIPVALIADWYKQATGDRNNGTTRVSRRFGQMIGKGQMQRLHKDPSHRHKRCFIWTGENADLRPVLASGNRSCKARSNFSRSA